MIIIGVPDVLWLNRIWHFLGFYIKVANDYVLEYVSINYYQITSCHISNFVVLKLNSLTSVDKSSLEISPWNVLWYSHWVDILFKIVKRRR